ncbi:hypothetical protein [Massilia sp. Leaf139]|uniref:phage tail assembly protein T n=1 Tax=Massilia sp. Leaf139 TaxID=1736272 RepID=UPI0006FB2A46|nr:hypothetical protein [Massilia sp. Leaf139]KQQ89929.1 hypothetical protein ASF77_23410 [Massilia sp. Leaf139]
MQAEIDSAEFAEWQAFYLLEPFGGEVADRRHGSAMALQANAQRGKDVEPYKLEDFMFGSVVQENPEPELLDDPVAQSNLIRAKMFGLPPK